MTTPRGTRTGLIVGGVIVLLGIITLGLSLGVLHGVENLVWVMVGLVAAGGLAVGYIENRQHVWMAITAYVFLALSIALSVWVAFGGGPGLTAAAFGLLGLPFGLVYALSHGKAWQALIAAAAAFIAAQIVLFGPLIRLFTNDGATTALMLASSFLFALTLAFVVLWFPNRRDPHFAWTAYPPHVLFVLSVACALAALGLPQLMIPALLLYIGGVLLVRFMLVHLAAG